MLSNRIRELDTKVVVLTQALRDCIGPQSSK